MNKRILWIDDDFEAIKGLMKPLVNDGFQIDPATTALQAYEMAKQWREYDLIVVDLIFPISDAQTEIAEMPSLVKAWDKGEETPVGIGFSKWVLAELKVKCPVLIMSVVNNPLEKHNLSQYKSLHAIQKRGLLPKELRDEIKRILRY
jgi:CheY-like chemotaxis protein